MSKLKGELIAKLAGPGKIAFTWEVSIIPEKIIELYFQLNMKELTSIIRIYDVTAIYFNGKNAHHVYEIPIPYENGFWMIKGLKENRSYIGELGVYLSETEFFPLLQSNCIQTVNGAVDEHVVNPLMRQNATPKWIDHVSTYSYYPESPEENNG